VQKGYNIKGKKDNKNLPKMKVQTIENTKILLTLISIAMALSVFSGCATSSRRLSVLNKLSTFAVQKGYQESDRTGILDTPEFELQDRNVRDLGDILKN
jgi:hypothetical protein